MASGDEAVEAFLLNEAFAKAAEMAAWANEAAEKARKSAVVSVRNAIRAAQPDHMLASHQFSVWLSAYHKQAEAGGGDDGDAARGGGAEEAAADAAAGAGAAGGSNGSGNVSGEEEEEEEDAGGGGADAGAGAAAGSNGSDNGSGEGEFPVARKCI